MKWFFAGLLLLCLLPGSGVFAQKKTVDFSGTWLLDQKKSEMPDGRRGRMMASLKMIVKQETNKLTVQSIRLNRNGDEDSSSVSYTLDGKESENKRNNRRSISTAEWADGAQTLEIFTEMQISRRGRQFTIESEALWTLVDGELVQKITSTTPRGERIVKLVYKNAEDK